MSATLDAGKFQGNNFSKNVNYIYVGRGKGMKKETHECKIN